MYGKGKEQAQCGDFVTYTSRSNKTNLAIDWLPTWTPGSESAFKHVVPTSESVNRTIAPGVRRSSTSYSS